MVPHLLFSFKFNDIIPFDKWKTVVLTKIKSFMPEEGGSTAAAPKKVEEDEPEPEF
jgi:hypothetical protein